jgi:hypothetical protein
LFNAETHLQDRILATAWECQHGGELPDIFEYVDVGGTLALPCIRDARG